MNDKEVVGALLDTVLSMPNMTELAKLDAKITKKDVLLLSNLIAKGIENKGPGLLDNIPPDAAERLSAFAADALAKVGLSDFYDKLKSIGGK